MWALLKYCHLLKVSMLTKPCWKQRWMRSCCYIKSQAKLKTSSPYWKVRESDTNFSPLLYCRCNKAVCQDNGKVSQLSSRPGNTLCAKWPTFLPSVWERNALQWGHEHVRWDKVLAYLTFYSWAAWINVLFTILADFGALKNMLEQDCAYAIQTGDVQLLNRISKSGISMLSKVL